MKKTLKIALNILTFLLIIGLGYYMVHSMMSGEKTAPSDVENRNSTFVSPYKQTNRLDAASKIRGFAISENTIYAALSDKVSVFDLSGQHQRDFAIKADVRDIRVEETTIYLLYPTSIDLYSLEGKIKDGWKACSAHADYCSLTSTQDYVFVTDAEDKLICQFDKQGKPVRFIKSPEGFIIPSYAFDIIQINDTLYCSNSGRHRVESYTPEGKFIASFGVAGTQAGAFAGCCNPVYLEKSADGNILTSEKGIPRISCYGKDGTFRTVLFDSNTLGGGTSACEMHVSGENIYIANGKTISVYSRDVACNVSTEKSCAGCEAECPLRKEVKKYTKE